MLNFDYCVPTKVIFGRDTELRAGEEILACGGKKVLVVYGGRSAVNSGLLGKVEKVLTEAGLEYFLLGGVKPNPRLSKVREGTELALGKGIDFLLAIGGGSVIDTAKAIGYALANPDADLWDMFIGKAPVKGCAPVGVVLTIAASGSETSNSCVITNEDGWFKKALNTEFARPRFAIMNPELTYSLPAFQTASGGADIMMHTQERYFSNVKNTELVDAMAEGLLVTVKNNIVKALKTPDDYNARAELMWAGSLSHNGLTGTGKQGDFACHRIEHELGGMFDVAHGAGLTAIWQSWARYVVAVNPERFAKFAVNVMGCTMNYDDPMETALAGIEAMGDYYRKIGMPTNLRELGITELSDEQIHEMAMKCTNDDTAPVGAFKQLYAADVETILNMAR